MGKEKKERKRERNACSVRSDLNKGAALNGGALNGNFLEGILTGPEEE